MTLLVKKLQNAKKQEKTQKAKKELTQKTTNPKNCWADDRPTSGAGSTRRIGP
jgi:hypothetical protein